MAQRAVLCLTLDAYPESLTIPHLAREIDRGDATERAIVVLVGLGLLECSGIAVRPTRAIVYFEQLELP
ncbi:MAG: hypothetical protein ACRDLL_13125 [Solirubrobacterales bacterium]